MALHITSLRLADFRSYHRFELADLGDLTIFVGPNAVGKSNILEAIQLTTAFSSFRAATTRQLIRWGCDQARVATHMEDEARDIQVELALREGSRRYFFNGKPTRSAALRDNLPAVTFTPDDLMLVKGSPGIRRNALDSLGMQLSPSYRSVKRDYDKILQQRNTLLKQQVAPLFIQSVNEVFCKVAAQLCVYRLQIYSQLKSVFSERYHDIASGSEKGDLSYRLSWEQDATAPTDRLDSGSVGVELLPEREQLQLDIDEALQRVAEEERVRRQTLVGPHRDELAFFLDGHNASRYASQGQQRTLAIAFKLSEFTLIERKRHQRPLLLLDDVMSEIDAARRELLTECLKNAAQTFITTTNLGYFTPEMLSFARIVQLPIDTDRIQE